MRGKATRPLVLLFIWLTIKGSLKTDILNFQAAFPCSQQSAFHLAHIAHRAFVGRGRHRGIGA